MTSEASDLAWPKMRYGNWAWPIYIKKKTGNQVLPFNVSHIPSITKKNSGFLFISNWVHTAPYRTTPILSPARQVEWCACLPGQASVLPFAADIRSRPQDHKQILLLSDLQITCDRWRVRSVVTYGSAHMEHDIKRISWCSTSCGSRFPFTCDGSTTFKFKFLSVNFLFFLWKGVPYICTTLHKYITKGSASGGTGGRVPLNILHF